MEYLAGYFRQDSRSTFLLLRRSIRKKDRLPILFLAAGQGRTADACGKAAAGESFPAAGAACEGLMEDWYQGKALEICARGNEVKCVDAAAESFHNLTAENARMFSGFAALFCMGEECFYVWCGGMDICLINLCFGKIHIGRLSGESEEPVCRRAVLEPDVGVLLGGQTFLEKIPEPLLRECLTLGDMRRQNQLERHLAELSGEAARRGVMDIVAAMVLTKEADAGESSALEEILGKYGYMQPRIVGVGAFGHVYRVTASEGRGKAACKVARGMEERRLLRREAERLERLEHPLFPRCINYIEEADYALLFMEYVRGRDLSALLRQRSFSPGRAMRTALQLAEGLQYLHRLPEPVLYRDLKPENIRICAGGRVKLLDLGCACRLSEASESMAGSPGYAAPEQLDGAGRPCGFYSDVYALGRVLTAMLEGRRLPAKLQAFLEECTDEIPGNRPRSMEIVAERLKDLLRSRV